MAQANPLWGAPRIHGELQLLGIDAADECHIACATIDDAARENYSEERPARCSARHWTDSRVKSG
jgi:hypothetical protein